KSALQLGWMIILPNRFSLRTSSRRWSAPVLPPTSIQQWMRAPSEQLANGAAIVSFGLQVIAHCPIQTRVISRREVLTSHHSGARLLPSRKGRVVPTRPENLFAYGAV